MFARQFANRRLGVVVVASLLLASAPGRAEPAGAVVGRSPALDDWEPYVGLQWRSRPTLLGLDGQGRPVVEVARRTMAVGADGSTATAGGASVVATAVRQIPVTCHRDDQTFNLPGAKRCEARIPEAGIALRSGEGLAARNTSGYHAVLTSLHRRWATLKDVAVSSDGARWVAVWRSDTEDEAYGPTLYGISTGTVADLRTRLAAAPLRDWLGLRRPRATPDVAEAQRLAPGDARLAVTLARVYARLGREDDAVAVLRPHLGVDAMAVYVEAAQHAELDRLRSRLRAQLADVSRPPPSVSGTPATWRKRFVLGESRDGRYLALRREDRSGCADDHWYYLEIVEAVAPYRRVAALLVEHLDESSSGRPRLVVQRRAAANDLLWLFGFVETPFVSATPITGADSKRRFRYAPERLGVVSVESSSTARLLRDGQVKSQVQLPGKRWGHGNGTVESVAIDLQRRRAFLRWGEARPECCAGDARMPLDHDQISIVPLP